MYLCSTRSHVYAPLHSACWSWTIFHNRVGNRTGFADTSETFAVMSRSVTDGLCSCFRNGLAVQGGCLEVLSHVWTGNTTCPWMLRGPKYMCGSGCAFFAHTSSSSCVTSSFMPLSYQVSRQYFGFQFELKMALWFLWHSTDLITGM